MRKHLLILTLVLICTGGITFGDPLVVGNIIKFGDGLPGNSFTGGPFNVYYASQTNGSAPLFQTFCLERNEYLNYFNPTTGLPTFQVDSIGPAAIAGGGGAVSGSDPLDVKTAWLYYMFRTGGLGSVTGWNAASFETQMMALQNAIWQLENEASSATTLSNALIAAATLATGTGGWINDGKVAVVNINWYQGGGTSYPQGTRAQSVLTLVPEPSALLLLGVGMLGLGAVRKRR